MPTVPGEKIASARKFGISEDTLAAMDAMPMPANHASDMATGNIGGESAGSVIPDIIRVPSGANEYDQISKKKPELVGNEYDALEAKLNETKKTTVATSLYLGSAKNPDHSAKVAELSRKLNLPFDTVERNYDMFARDEKVAGNDYDAMVAHNPKLADWLTNPDNAAVAHDSVDELKGIESTVSEHGKAYKSLAAMNNTATSFAANIARLPNLAGALSYLPYNAYQKYTGGQQVQYPQSNPVADYLDEQAGRYTSVVPELGVDVAKELGEGNLSKAGSALGYQVVSQIPQLLAMGMAGAANGLKYLSALGASTASETNKDLANKGVDPATAVPVALSAGAIEMGTEALPLGFIEHMGQQIVKKAGKQGALEVFKGMWKTMVAGSAVETIEEEVGLLAKKTVDYVTGVDRDAFKNIGNDLTNTGLVSFFTGGLATGPAATINAMQQVASKQQTSVASDLYDQIGEKISKAKLWRRSPEAQKQFVAEVLKESDVKDVYISPEAFVTYFQSEDQSPSEMMAKLGVTQEQLEEAQETGSPLKIDHATYLANTLDTDAYAGLKNDIKYQPDTLSVNEQKESDKQVEADLKQVDAEAKPQTAEDKTAESGKAVRDDVAAQLKEINQDPKQAILYRGFEVLGRRAGIDPLELYNRYALKIGTGETSMDVVAAQTLNQIAPMDLGVTPEHFAAPEVDVELPRLNADDLAQIGAADKPIVLKKNIVEKNRKNHPEIPAGEDIQILQEALYNPTQIIQSKPKEKPNYWTFVRQNGKAKLSLIEVSATKSGYEIVNWYQGDAKTVEKLQKRAKREGGQVLITERANSQGAAALSALTPGNSSIAENASSLQPTQAPDMSKEARMARAEALGFDTSKVYYHGTKSDITEFDASTRGTQTARKGVKPEAAFYFAMPDEPGTASYYAERVPFERAQVEALKANPNIDIDELLAIGTGNTEDHPDVKKAKAAYEKAFKKLRAKAKKAGKKHYELPEYEALKNGEMKDYGDAQRNVVAIDANVIPVYLKFSNPFTFSTSNPEQMEFLDSLERQTPGVEHHHLGALVDWAKAQGYDAIIREGSERSIAVFEPNQIRSVNAEFLDGDSANILNQDYSQRDSLAMARKAVESLSDASTDAVADAYGIPRKELKDLDKSERRKVYSREEIIKAGGDPGPRQPLGQIRITQDRKFNIDLLKTANKSTFIHETGHLYAEVMADIVADIEKLPEQTDHQKQLVEDFTTLMTWAGAEVGKPIPVESHEKIARGFEAYLFEGKAPTEELRSAFARFRIWLVRVYKNIGALNVHLTDEVRDVMDRLLATDEEINQVDAELNRQPLFTDAQFQGMPVEKVKNYLKAQEEDRERKTTEITQKLMKHHEKVRSQEYAAEKAGLLPEIEAQVNEIPVYKAINALKSGNMPKLSAASIAEFGKDVSKGFPKGTVATKKSGEGLPVEMAAEMLGFDSAQELISQLTSAEDVGKLTDRLAEEEMAKRFPDLLEVGLHEEVIEAAHNASRSKLIRMELDMIPLPVLKEAIRRVARRVPTQASVRARAKEIIGTKALLDIKPSAFMRAEVKAAKEAGVLLAKGDFDGAFAAKSKELLNHELYLSAIEAQEFYEKSLKQFKKIAKSDESMAKNRDTDLVNAARSILARFGIGKVEGQANPESYLKNIKAYDPAQYASLEAIIQAATEVAGVSDQIPYNDFVTMADTVNAIWDMSKEAKEIEVEGKKVELATAIEDLNKRTEEMTKGGPIPGKDQAVTDKEKRSMSIASIAKLARRAEHWAYARDKGELNGPFQKYIIRPVLQGTAKYRLALVETMKELSSIIKGFDIRDSKALIDAPELGYKFTKPELIMAVLHSGNDSNLEKLLVGRGWGEIDEEGTLDRSRWDEFIQRAFRDGLVTKADMDAAQAVWDLNEKLKPAAQRAHKKLMGYYFNEITANPVQTPWGEYRGGYMPAIADHQLSTDAGIRSSQQELEQTPMQMFPTTGKGFTKSRQDSYATPLSLDMTLIKSHMDKVLKFSHIEVPVRDAAKIINNKEFRSKLDAYDKTAANDLLVPWLKRAATQQSTTPGMNKKLDQAFRTFRRASSIQFMVMNVVNALQNNLAVFPAMTRVSPKHLAGSFKRYMFDRAGYAQSVMESSTYMKTRVGESAMEIGKEIEDMIANPTKFQELRESSIKHGYILDRITNNMMEVVIWGAAFDEASQNGSMQDAVNHADGTIRQVTAAFNAEDISRYESGSPFVRLFTMFSGFFNTQSNLFKTELEIAREEGGTQGLARASKAYGLVVAAPAIASALIYAVMSGKGIDEDDDGEYIEDIIDLFFGSQFRYLMAFVPGGNLVTNLVNRFNDKPFDDKISLSPAVSALEKSIGAVSSVPSAIKGKGSVSKALKESLTALGLATGTPMASLAKPLGYAADVSQGKAKPSGPVDAARGFITGAPGK
jgi:hypothetical protein